MNPEIERLMVALRNAHAAGDTAAATRFAQLIRERQAAATAGDSAAQPQGDDGWRPGTTPASEAGAAELAEQSGFGDNGVGTEAGRSFGGPREAGREFAGKRAAGWTAPLAAAIQGIGMGVTPVSAADEYVRSRMGDGKPRSWDDSMEFARGLREGSAEENPAEYAAGGVLGIVGGVKAGAALMSKAPAVVKSVFTLASGQTKRNIARMVASGATAAGAAAGLQGDEVLPAAKVGGALGGAMGAVVGSAVGVGRAVMARISPEHAAIRALSKRFNESGATIAKLYNDFVDRTGRRPGLAEVVTEVEAGRAGQVGAQYANAGRVFREAEETATNARPGEVQRAVERGGRTTTVPEQVGEVQAVVREAQSLRGRRSFGGRVTSTAQGQLDRRDNVMDEFMERYGDHYVHATEGMKDILERQDVQELMPPILRRRINDAIQNGMDMGTIDIPLKLWDKVRKYAGTKAKTEPLYREYRNRIRDYVGERIPEYGRALVEYGRRSTGAKATTLAERGVKGDTREFVEMLRIADTKPHAVTTMTSSQAGVRKWLGDQMHERPRQVLERLGRDSRLRTNLRTILSQDEMVRLESLGEQYGLRVNILEGVKAGRKGLTDDAATFAEAVRTARDVPGKAAAVSGGLRGALAGKGGEDAASAVGTARALTEPGLQDRLATAFGAPEAARLGQAGELMTRAARNLRAAAPAMNQAQQEAAEQAQKVYNAITGIVAASGTASGALKAHLAQRMVSRVKLGAKAAERMAEYATDPNMAKSVIQAMRRAGVSADELLKWYQDAAIAAGISAGGAQ